MEKKRVYDNMEEYLSCFKLYDYLNHKAKVIGLKGKEIDFYFHTLDMLRKIDCIIWDTQILLSDMYGPNATDVICFDEWRNMLEEG